MKTDVIQNYLEELSVFIDSTIGLMDQDGVVLACTGKERIGGTIELDANRLKENRFFETKEWFYMFVENSVEEDIILFASHGESVNDVLLKLIAHNIAHIYVSSTFDTAVSKLYRTLLSGNFDLKEMIVLAGKLEVDINKKCIVMLVETPKDDIHSVLELLWEISKDVHSAVMVGLSEELTAVICDYTEDKAVEETAWIIVNTLESEALLKPVVAIGSVSAGLIRINESYETAKVILDSHRIFHDSQRVLNYHKLGISGLISMIPHDVGEIFVKEVLTEEIYREIGAEYMTTIQTFFENNLNISEASRKMFIHRNTLVYRLDKIKKLTGLDITKFDDAVTLKTAIMIKRYAERALI